MDASLAPLIKLGRRLWLYCIFILLPPYSRGSLTVGKNLLNYKLKQTSIFSIKKVIGFAMDYCCAIFLSPKKRKKVGIRHEDVFIFGDHCKTCRNLWATRKMGVNYTVFIWQVVDETKKG